MPDHSYISIENYILRDELITDNMTQITLTQKQLDEVAKTAAMLAREGHKDSTSLLVSELKSDNSVIIQKLEAIEAQTIKTNGRVTKLESENNDQCVKIAVMGDQVTAHSRILWGGGTTVFGLVLTAIIMSILK